MNRTLGVKGKVTFFASFKSNRHQFFIQICPLKSYSKRKELFNCCEDEVFWAFAVIALGFLEGFDEWIGTRALGGKDFMVKGVRDGSEVREDRTRWLVQEIEKETDKQKSFIAPK